MKSPAGITISIFVLIVGFSVTNSRINAQSVEENTGSYKESPETTQAFKSNQYNSDYTYYYAESQYYNGPIAVLGVNRNYNLVKKSAWGQYKTRWKEFEPATGKLKELVENMDTRRSKFGQKYFYDRRFGCILFDSAGAEVGVLFTKKSQKYGPRIRILEDNMIHVVPNVWHSVSMN